MSIIHIGLDVHSNSISASCYNAETNTFSLETKFVPTSSNFANYIRRVRQAYPDAEIKAGYEAGCLGFVPFRTLSDLGVLCDVIAPTSILSAKRKVKTDKIDARYIARTLAYSTYSPVYVPTPEQDEIRAFQHMRDDMADSLKRIKQKINAFCLLRGLHFAGTKTKWTQAHIAWLKSLSLPPTLQMTLDEYLEELFHYMDKVARLDAKIEEFAKLAPLADAIGKMRCFKGIETHCAMTLVTELGDFNRFRKGEGLTGYVGITPGEHSSGKSVVHTSMTKAGNARVRKVLIEIAQKYGVGKIGYKSKKLKARQQGQSAETIGFADRAVEKLMRKWKEMERRGKNTNVIKCAIARRLLEYIWALLTGRTEFRAQRAGA